MRQNTFPTAIDTLAVYFVIVMLWVVNNATRLSIDPDKITALQALYGNDVTEGTYLFCKHKYDITPGRKGTLICQNLRTASTNMKNKLSEIFNDVPDSKWTDADRVTTNRKTGLPKDPTHHTSSITSSCILDLTMLPLALIQGGGRSSTDSKHHSIPADGNGIEIRYAAVKGKFPIQESMKDKVKETCIGPDDGTNSVIFTKSLFTIQLEAVYTGYNLAIWGRWIDIKNKARAGQWSEGHNLMIG